MTAVRGELVFFELGGMVCAGRWVGVDDLEPGVTLVVEGPVAGEWWRDGNRVVSVRSVEVVGDRTNTRVLLSDDGEGEEAGAWGCWSRMLFLRLLEPVGGWANAKKPLDIL